MDDIGVEAVVGIDDSTTDDGASVTVASGEELTSGTEAPSPAGRNSSTFSPSSPITNTLAKTGTSSSASQKAQVPYQMRLIQDQNSLYLFQ